MFPAKFGLLLVALSASSSNPGALSMPDVPPPAARPSPSRVPPPRLEPVVAGGVAYDAPWSSRGAVVAKSVATGQELWRVLVVEYAVEPSLETDVQDVYLRKLELAPGGGELRLEDERGMHYVLDLATRRARPIDLWAKLTARSYRPGPGGWRLSVQLELQNPFPRVLRLDGPSVAEHGELSNDLFAVTVDGKEVRYSGAMVKRAPPARFIELQPRARHKVEVELGDNYAIPPGDHHVTVAYRHTNHFSPDDLLLHSAPIEVHLSGEGYRLEPKPRPQ